MLDMDKINKKIEYKKKVFMGKTSYKSNLLQVFDATYRFKIREEDNCYKVILIQLGCIGNDIGTVNFKNLENFSTLEEAYNGVTEFLKEQVEIITNYIKKEVL